MESLQLSLRGRQPDTRWRRIGRVTGLVWESEGRRRRVVDCLEWGGGSSATKKRAAPSPGPPAVEDSERNRRQPAAAFRRAPPFAFAGASASASSSGSRKPTTPPPSIESDVKPAPLLPARWGCHRTSRCRRREPVARACPVAGSAVGSAPPAAWKPTWVCPRRRGTIRPSGPLGPWLRSVPRGGIAKVKGLGVVPRAMRRADASPRTVVPKRGPDRRTLEPSSPRAGPRGLAVVSRISASGRRPPRSSTSPGPRPPAFGPRSPEPGWAWSPVRTAGGRQ